MKGWRGFSMIELVMVLVVMGVLAAVIGPKLMGSGPMRSQAWHDQSLSALRLARSMSSSHRRVVCVRFTGNTVRLQIALAHPPVSCATPVPGADGRTNFAELADNSITTTLRQAGVSYAGELYFQPEGRVTVDLAGDTPGQWVLSITGAGDITIDGVTAHAL